MAPPRYEAIHSLLLQLHDTESTPGVITSHHYESEKQELHLTRPLAGSIVSVKDVSMEQSQTWYDFHLYLVDYDVIWWFRYGDEVLKLQGRAVNE